LIEQSRAPGSTAILTKKCHCQRYSNPASGENLTNTRPLGQMSSSEKSEGTLSQQFRKVLTQSALSFSIQDHEGLILYFFSHDHGVAANGEKHQSPRHEKHRALHLSACRLAESIVFTLVNCGPNGGSRKYHLGSLTLAKVKICYL
jgi:hypothetical protein